MTPVNVKFMFAFLSVVLLTIGGIYYSISSHAESPVSQDLNYQSKMASRLISVDFEVFGIVQGVFFRKYTRSEAKRLHLRGWCENTRQNTVKGQMEGLAENVSKMKIWLQTTGSPHSKIDRAEFSNEREINDYSFSDFSFMEPPLKTECNNLKHVSVDFEVFGKVQYVKFRDHTKEEADKLNLVGWVQNTFHESVIGCVQGKCDHVNIMKCWLSTVGSPLSQIAETKFTNERVLEAIEFDRFEIRQRD